MREMILFGALALSATALFGATTNANGKVEYTEAELAARRAKHLAGQMKLFGGYIERPGSMKGMIQQASIFWRSEYTDRIRRHASFLHDITGGQRDIGR